MSLIPWNATVQDDSGNFVPLPVVTVRNASDDSLATIYDIDGVVVGNPITGLANGFVQFQVQPGRYTIEGALDGSTTAVWEWEAAVGKDVSFTSRSDLVSWWALNSGNTPNGTILKAGGLQYVVDSTSTAITDLSGVSPFGQVYADHFGALGDLEFTGIDNVLGPERTSGTNDISAFQAADDYAFENGFSVKVKSGQYFIEGQFEPRVKWYAESDFGTVIWAKCSVYQSNIWIKTSNAGWSGFKMIGQYDRAGTSKPANAGHLGNIVVVGNFLTGDTQEPVNDVEVRVRSVRARDTASQNSDGSFLHNGMGYVVGCNWQLGTWGAGTNTSGNTGFIQHHWGGLLDDGGAWDISQDPTLYGIIETYHPQDCTVEFIGDVIDCAAHNIIQVWTRSATINVRIGACSSTGAARPIYDLAGDETNRISVLAQKGLVGLGNKTGVQQHLNCDPASISANESVMTFSRGTSKFETAPGSVDGRQDQYRHSIFSDGLVLSADSGDQLVRVFTPSYDGKYVSGQMYLTANSTDIDKAFYWQSGVGGEVDIQSANRAMHIRQGELDKLFLRTDLGPDGNVSPNGDFQLGWNSNNAGLVVETTRHTATVASALSEGDTVISTSALPIDIHIGARVFVNGNEVKVSRFASAGSNEIEIKPSPYDASISDPIVIILQSGIGELTSEISSSEYGIILRGAYVNKADISKMDGQGRHAAFLETHDNAATSDSIASTMRIVGGRLPMIGRIGSSTGVPTGHTIRVNSKCHVTLIGVEIPANPHIVSHLQLVRTGASGPWGTAALIGCRIEDPTSLVTATVNSESISLSNCVDFNGAPVTLADL